MPIPAIPAAETTSGAAAWRDDVRFFLTCYAAGTLFFLIMLS